jgi:hypothetical protein
MKKLKIEDIEEIEERRVSAMSKGSTGVHYQLINQDIRRLIADNKRLRTALNKLAGHATEATS